MISVIIPTHNRAKTFQKAVNSALNQNYKDIEVIIISDGSTDETNEKGKLLEKEDKRINFISYESPKGANYARNLGISNAEGEYIAFLDDDDVWEEDKLSKQVELFNTNNKIGLVSTGVKILFENEKIEYNSINVEEGDLSKKILFSNCIGSTSSVMVKEDILRKHGGFDENLEALQDYDLWIRLCQDTFVATVKSPCVKYYNSLGSNQISGNTKKYERADNYITNKYQYLFEKLSKAEWKQRSQDRKIGLAKRAHRNNNKKESFKYLAEAAKISFNFKIVIHFYLLIFNYKFILKIGTLMK